MYCIHGNILAVKKCGDFTPNWVFKNIVGIIIWWRIHESCKCLTSTVVGKMWRVFILVIPISIFKSPNFISRQINQLYLFLVIVNMLANRLSAIEQLV